MFFGRGDIPKIRYFIDQITDEQERSIAMEKLNQTVGFAIHNVCRRRQLLSFFGEDYSSDNCGACDICSGGVEQIDITVDAQIVMSAVSRTHQRFGTGHIVDIVIGADTKRIRELRHDTIKTYGAGKHRDKKYWRFVVDELLAQGLIRQDGDRYPVLKLTQRGSDVLYSSDRVSALKREDTKKKPQGKGLEAGRYNEELFESLRIVRKNFADEQQVPPYVIFSDKTIHDMCRHYPASLSDMNRISGVGNAKLERYGEVFLLEIRKYLKENPGISATAEVAKARIIQAQKKKKGETLERTYELYLEGLSIDEIAKLRNLSSSTVAVHMEKLILSGYDIDIERFVDGPKKKKIEELFRKTRQWTLNPLIEHFAGAVNYGEARLVRACMMRPQERKK